MKSRLDIPHAEEIVSRNLAQWESRRRALEEEGLHPPERPGPYLSISRQAGSGAEALVEELSLRLGWRSYDRTLLEEMAHRARVDERVMERIEKGSHNSLHEAILLSLERGYPGHHVYFKHMAALVSSLGLEGRVILVGRGAHFLLPPEAGLRVRCVAPWEKRVEEIRRRHQCSLTEARERLERVDKRRREMVWKFFRRELDDVQAYDLVVNLGALDLKAAVEAVCSALEAKLQVEVAV